MQSPPPLLLVQLALPPTIQPLFHVHQTISDFLLPTTIDGAVFNELHRVMKVYATLRPWTVGAMDGAAARGRLNIMQKLQANRMEGCSSMAFIGAAANAHFEVLWWLNEYYAGLSRPAEMVKAAAANGHVRVVEFLWRGLSGDQLEPAMAAAAFNGHAQVVEVLLPRVSNVTNAFIAAAANDQVSVLQVLISRKYAKRVSDIELAVKKALQSGCSDAVGFLRGAE